MWKIARNYWKISNPSYGATKLRIGENLDFLVSQKSILLKVAQRERERGLISYFLRPKGVQNELIRNKSFIILKTLEKKGEKIGFLARN